MHWEEPLLICSFSHGTGMGRKADDNSCAENNVLEEGCANVTIDTEAGTDDLYTDETLL